MQDSEVGTLVIIGHVALVHPPGWDIEGRIFMVIHISDVGARIRRVLFGQDDCYDMENDPELKGSVGEGPNQTNYSDRGSVRILSKLKFRSFR